MRTAILCLAVSVASANGCQQATPPQAANDRVTSVILEFNGGSPKSRGVAVGEPTQLKFEARDVNGTIVPDAQPLFKSSDTTAVIVTQSGVATALRAPAGAMVSATIQSGTRAISDSVRVFTAVPL